MKKKLSLLNKKALFLLAMVVFCYIAAFLRRPFTFVILFSVLCYVALIFIGAAIYYVSTSTGIWGGIVGVLKALVWPAFLVHGLLKFIGA